MESERAREREKRKREVGSESYRKKERKEREKEVESKLERERGIVMVAESKGGETNEMKQRMIHEVCVCDRKSGKMSGAQRKVFWEAPESSGCVVNPVLCEGFCWFLRKSGGQNC